MTAMTSKAQRKGDSALKVFRKWVRDSYMGDSIADLAEWGLDSSAEGLGRFS